MDRYEIKSNRESGFGRYDVMLRPRNMQKDKAIIMEFKVISPKKRKIFRRNSAKRIGTDQRKEIQRRVN